ncbi:MAG: hypothetical protein D6719_11095 [Candidatus Dadabacteria bacterium]|nr:MAG: hypothetical protein D6719_11095 [Candidatus Dadabacteria bacterium]
MLSKYILKCLTILVFLLVLTSPALALDEQEEEEKLPPSGTLASTVGGGYGDARVDIPWGSDAKGGAPISGSVSRAADGKWLMKVFNNSEDIYDVNLEVVQYDSRGRKIKSDHFTYRLKPGGSEERIVSGRSNTKNAALRLNGWKKISTKKKKQDEEKSASS